MGRERFAMGWRLGLLLLLSGAALLTAVEVVELHDTSLPDVSVSGPLANDELALIQSEDSSTPDERQRAINKIHAILDGGVSTQVAGPHCQCLVPASDINDYSGSQLSFHRVAFSGDHHPLPPIFATPGGHFRYHDTICLHRVDSSRIVCARIGSRLRILPSYASQGCCSNCDVCGIKHGALDRTYKDDSSSASTQTSDCSAFIAQPQR